MRLKPLTYTHTLHACYGGYIVQAIIANLAPLFFVVFQTAFDVSFEQIGCLIYNIYICAKFRCFI